MLLILLFCYSIHLKILERKINSWSKHSFPFYDLLGTMLIQLWYPLSIQNYLLHAISVMFC